MIYGIPWKGNAYALNISIHEQYPYDSLDQNNLAQVGKALHYPSKFEKVCYGTQCIFEKTYKGNYKCIV
jgi:hypothetical protein